MSCIVELSNKESFHKSKFVFDSFLSCISTDAPNVKKKAKTFNIRSTKLKMRLSCTSTFFQGFEWNLPLHCLFSPSDLGDIMSLRYGDVRYCRGHIWPESLFRLVKLIAIVSPNKHTEVNPVMQLKNPKREFIKFRFRVGTEYKILWSTISNYLWFMDMNHQLTSLHPRISHSRH